MRTSVPPLLPLFRSEMQVRLLALVLLQPERHWTLQGLAEALDAPQSSVHRELARAEAAGVIRRADEARPYRFSAATDDAAYEPLAELLRRSVGVENELRASLDRPDVLAAVIYGSWASGTRRPDSDIDVLVVGNSDRRSGMNRRTRGEADIEQLLASGELQRVAGAGAAGGPWLAKAAATLHTAAGIVASDPNSAYTLAYDAARFACVGLLAQQGLRPTTSGGHYVVQRAMLRQFGAAFDPFAVMRRRRNELEYPEFPDETMEPHEAAEAIGNTKAMIESAAKLLDHLGLF